VVLIHGLGLGAGMWDGFNPAVAKTGFTAVTVDVRGHGGSPVVDRETTLDELAGDVASFIDAEGLDRPHLIGFSMGGMISMRIAAAGRPLASLCLASTSAEPEPRRAEYEPMAAILRDNPMTPDGADVFLAMLFSPGFLETHEEIRDRYRAMVMANDRRGVYRASLAVIRRPAFLDRLKAVAAPTLIVSGTEDQATPPACAHHMAEAIPGSRLFSLQGSAHLVNEERPKEFARAVIAHMKEHP
jgi:3-oxoadipate enol-lactonase